MNTIFIPVYPKPSGANVTRLDVDFNEFDPHNGIKFSVVLKNPQDLTLDRVYTCMYGDDWQNWPSEQTAEADYNYVKKVVLENLGYTEAIAPFITTQPVDQKVIDGQPAQFSVVASGDSPLNCQWIKNGADIEGANSSVYSVAKAGTGDLGSYSVKISNLAGSVASSYASLSLFQAPTITSQPQALDLIVSGFGVLNVGAMGDQPLAFQWSKDNETIIGASGSALQIADAKLSDSGNYFVTISNVAGSVQSDLAVVAVTEPVPPPAPIPTPIPDVIPDVVPDPIPTSDNA
jgi:hypothetical protein